MGLAHWTERGYGWWAVELKKSGELIGWCGLNHLPDTDEIEVLYLIGEDHWGKGLATEAAFSTVEYAFEVAGLETLVGIVHPENIASRRVLEKIGMPRQTWINELSWNNVKQLMFSPALFGYIYLRLFKVRIASI
jgi:RimJ/RimL family protein N-acetyltransferase